MTYFQKTYAIPSTKENKAYEGQCAYLFTVAGDGTVEDIKIIRGVEAAPNFNAEVIRVMRGMPKWKPGTQEGKSTRVKYNLPITFGLD